MLRKNPRGNYSVMHETSFVDPTAILCGQIIVGENLFISRETDLVTIPKVAVDACGFSESVSRMNVQLARAYRRIQNEFLRRRMGPMRAYERG